MPLWALVAAQIGHDWGFFTMVTNLPTYMADILQYDITANGYLSSAPYVAMWAVSMLSAWLCDYLIDKNKISVTFARKFFTSVGRCSFFQGRGGAFPWTLNNIFLV